MSDSGTNSDPGIEAALAQMDPSSADLARAALDWMLPDRGSLREISQSGLQSFLWYHLPMKWMVETGVMHEVAWSLGDLFTVTGRERYARLCRAAQTHQLIDAWQEPDREPARKAMRVASAASGVEPADTPLLRWGAVMGTEEYHASNEVSDALERAIEAGDLVPGARRWKQQAARITDDTLLVVRADPQGHTLLNAVHRERSERWATEAAGARSELLSSVLPMLESRLLAPAEVQKSLLPMRWLLHEVGDGATLTQAGRLPKALVLNANERFGWFDLPGFTVRTETDLPELATLNELARRTRLITRRGRRIAVSAVGRTALNDPELLWTTVVAGVFAAGTFAGEGAALMGASLLSGPATMAQQDVDRIVLAALRQRWHTSQGEALDERSALHATRELRVVAGALHWVAESGSWQNRHWELTPAGRQAALLGLQLQARAPRDRP